MITVDNNITNEKVVLVVDDIFENLLILKRMLEKEGYKPLTASSAKDALEMVRVKEPQLILLDVYMPEMDGFELCEILKNDVKTKDIPIIFISGGMSKEDKIKGFKLGAVDFINKPFEAEEVSLRVNNHLQVYEMKINMEAYNKRLNKMVKDHAIKIKEEQRNTIVALKKMFFLHFPELEVTFKNVAYNCRFLAQALEFSDKYEKQINQNFIANIEEAVLLHDVGRVDKILSYEDKENCHELVGARFLEQLSFLSEHNELLSMSILVARTHNEKWDGSGLPHGIVGEDIPLVSRVFAVCNEFENACSKFRISNPNADERTIRDYATEQVVANSGTTLEPGIVNIFTQVYRQFSVIK